MERLPAQLARPPEGDPVTAAGEQMLRISVGPSHAAVELDRATVEVLRAQLGWWLAATSEDPR